jgi:hypothetical protein
MPGNVATFSSALDLSRSAGMLKRVPALVKRSRLQTSTPRRNGETQPVVKRPPGVLSFSSTPRMNNNQDRTHAPKQQGLGTR